MKLAEKILEKMSDISKPRFKFMIVLFTTILCLRGKMNFRNMSRYSDFSEKLRFSHLQSDSDRTSKSSSNDSKNSSYGLYICAEKR